MSLIRKDTPQDPAVGICIGPYGGPRGGGRFLMSEVLLYALHPKPCSKEEPWCEVCGIYRVRGGGLGVRDQGSGLRDKCLGCGD